MNHDTMQKKNVNKWKAQADKKKHQSDLGRNCVPKKTSSKKEIYLDSQLWTAGSNKTPQTCIFALRLIL